MHLAFDILGVHHELHYYSVDLLHLVHFESYQLSCYSIEIGSLAQFAVAGLVIFEVTKPVKLWNIFVVFVELRHHLFDFIFGYLLPVFVPRA